MMIGKRTSMFLGWIVFSVTLVCLIVFAGWALGVK